MKSVKRWAAVSNVLFPVLSITEPFNSGPNHQCSGCSPRRGSRCRQAPHHSTCVSGLRGTNWLMAASSWHAPAWGIPLPQDKLKFLPSALAWGRGWPRCHPVSHPVWCPWLGCAVRDWWVRQVVVPVSETQGPVPSLSWPGWDGLGGGVV